MAAEADLGNQLITQYQEKIANLETAIATAQKFDLVQDRYVDYFAKHSLGKETLEEFSELQHRTIDYLADLLSDPDFLSDWTFQLLSQQELSDEQMEKISDAYLKLSDANPPSNTPKLPTTENTLQYLRNQSQQQQPSLPQQQQPQQVQNPQLSSAIANYSNEARNLAAFSRPTVPAPPVPSSNGYAGDPWNEIREEAGRGNVLQALRAIDKLKPVDMRSMFG